MKNDMTLNSCAICFTEQTPEIEIEKLCYGEFCNKTNVSVSNEYCLDTASWD